MKRTFPLLALTLAALALSQPSPTRSLALADLRDKIEGGWAGQMIGVAFGAPTEFRYREQIIDAPLPEWKPEGITNALNQDDLYVDMTFAQVLDDKGLDATTADFGAMFREARYALWHANLAARRALKRGVPAELAGTPRYNAHANDIDFQIESDFIGLMAPGLPRASNDLAYRAGRVMNYGDGIYGGMFVSCMYAAAFFDDDPRRVVAAGLACLPPRSPYARTIADVLAWSDAAPGDWRKVWRQIEDKWNRREPCPEGALNPFNIDAKLNGAYIALGLLHGRGDFWKTLEISTRAGQDSDCNPSNACGILGTMKGYRWIPDQWKSHIPRIAGEKFRHTNFSFRSIVASTERRAIELVKRNGGRVEGQQLVVRMQTPKPAKLELWDDYGSPVERVAATDARFQWSGPWRDDRSVKLASAKGASVTVPFEGTGAILVGHYLPTGGTADVSLDGKPHSTVDAYPDEEARKTGESVWHAFNLKPGRHTLTLTLRGEPYSGSQGTDFALTHLVVFK